MATAKAQILEAVRMQESGENKDKVAGGVQTSGN